MKNCRFLLFSPCTIEFFTPAWVDGYSLESERQQVSLSLQNSSQNSGLSQERCCLDGFDSSFDFKFFQSSYQTFKDHSKRAFFIIIIIIIIIESFSHQF